MDRAEALRLREIARFLEGLATSERPYTVKTAQQVMTLADDAKLLHRLAGNRPKLLHRLAGNRPKLLHRLAALTELRKAGTKPDVEAGSDDFIAWLMERGEALLGSDPDEEGAEITLTPEQALRCGRALIGARSPGGTEGDGLTFSELRTVNVARQDSYGSHGSSWSLTDWMTAVTGEIGEAANLIKKVRREDFTLDEARRDIADELADVVTYIDLLAAAAGIDLGHAVTRKWQEVCERIGYDGPNLAHLLAAPTEDRPEGDDHRKPASTGEEDQP